MATVVLSMGALGADCSPSPPACRDGGIGPSGCGNGQHRVCLDRCVSYVGASANCSLNPCTGDICAPEYACVPSSSGSLTGTCQTAVTGIGCDVTSLTDRCLEGTFCQRRGTSTEVANNTACFETISAQGSAAGLCATPAREGERCTGDWNAAMQSITGMVCSPCEPGTVCVGGLCHRKCTVDTDCPCSDPALGLGCRAALPGSGTRFCDICRADGASCRGDGRPNYACCTSASGSACTASGADFRCCRGSTSACSIDVVGQCCDGLTCQSSTCQTCVALGAGASDTRVCCGANRRIINSVCAACRVAGDSAANVGECCPGLQFDSSQMKCKVGCTVMLGTPCAVPSAVGQCAVGRVTDCSATTGAPVCTSVAGATTELCDGVDNDCDGMVDNNFNVGMTCGPATAYVDSRGNAVTACTASPTDIGGHWECGRDRATARCVAIQGYDYCVGPGAGGSGPLDRYTRTTMNCGIYPANPGGTCVSGGCTPNGHCASFGGMSHCYNSECPNLWECWTSTDVGTESCRP